MTAASAAILVARLVEIIGFPSLKEYFFFLVAPGYVSSEIRRGSGSSGLVADRFVICEFSSDGCGTGWVGPGRIKPMAKRPPVLKVSGLRRAFGPNTIFEKFSLEVRSGEAIALTGRNGAGKSTLLRCLIGADRPDDGTVEVCGNPMSEASPDIRRDVATVIDDLDFFPDLSVVEHLDLLARAHGLTDPDELVDEVLEEVQLVPQSGQLPGTLSSGQRRRLALATAFVRPRKFLILDEPEQRLDTEGRGLAGRPAHGRTEAGFGDRLREPRTGAGRAGRDPGRRTGSAPGMSTLDEARLEPASPRELKGLMRDWRKGRATRNVMEAFNDAYVAVIGALMIGAMLTNVVLKAQRTVAECTTASCLSARTVLPWAAFATAVAVALGASRLFGPVLASAAEGFWLLDAPISRAKLLGARLVGAVVIGTVGGLVIGALVSALTGSGLNGVLVWAGATGLVRGGVGRVRGGPARCGTAPADPCRDVRLRACWRCWPWRRSSASRPAGSASIWPATSASSSAW